MRVFFSNARILYPPRDGPHVHVYQLTRHLIARGHEVITLEPDQNPVTTVRSRALTSVLSIIRSSDIIYCRPSESPTMAARLAGFPWRLVIPHTSAVVWEQNRALTASLRPVKRTPERIAADIIEFRRLARRVDAGIGVAPGATEELKTLLGIRHVYTISNASDPELFMPGLAPPPALNRTVGHLQVGWTGSHANSIHDAPLIEAAAALAHRMAMPFQFHVIGDTRSMFADEAPPNMTFHGPVAYQDLPAYLSAMDVGLVLYRGSTDGGSPLKLFDYMASACVPICSPGAAMRDIMDGEEFGFIQEWTPETLCAQLAALNREPEQRKRLAHRARTLIEERYSWAKVAERVEAVMLEALQRRSRQSR